ncbi:MAG: hypothetical protein SPE09_04530 [Alloprevotella sp.]|nr:hypothetical protein [Bacteroidales bacterium]MDY4557908.1 hypothetical protein [Alloprevotella sp.]
MKLLCHSRSGSAWWYKIKVERSNRLPVRASGTMGVQLQKMKKQISGQ